MDLPKFQQQNWTRSTFFPCQKWTCLDFGRKLDRVHFYPLPKVDLPGFRQETGPGPLFSPAKSGPAWISAAKLDRVHFFPLPKVDLPGFRQRNWTGSTFFPCQKWTCLDFGSETGPGPLFSPAKSGPAWISAAKLDRVHFFPLPKVDLPGFRQRNWTGSTFFPCQKWTCLDFGSETGPGPLFSPAKSGPAWISAGNWIGSTFFPCQKWTCLDLDSKTGPGPLFLDKMDQVHFWQGRSTFGRKKWTPRSIFFCQKWTGGPLFSRSTFGMTDHRVNPRIL